MPTNATPQSNNPVKQFPVRVALWLAFLCAVAAPLAAKVAQTTYAQRLIDLTLLKHPDLIVAAIHVTAPGSTLYRPAFIQRARLARLARVTLHPM